MLRALLLCVGLGLAASQNCSVPDSSKVTLSPSPFATLVNCVRTARHDRI